MKNEPILPVKGISIAESVENQSDTNVLSIANGSAMDG